MHPKLSIPSVLFPSEKKRHLDIVDLGRAPYDEVHMLQKSLADARHAGRIRDTLLFVEHPPTITLGRAAKAENLLLDAEGFRNAGIEVHEVGRGGDVTYHGPGQLVGYPIVALSPDREDVRKYVQSLEETMIRTAADYGITAGRIDGFNGTWVDLDGIRPRKIGAVGVRISRWITMHGFALNLDPEMAHFSMIVPCGISDKGVTSVALETGKQVGREEVLLRAAEHFAVLHNSTLSMRKDLGRNNIVQKLVQQEQSHAAP